MTGSEVGPMPDLETLVALLSVDYPLLDPPLIIAFLSDYDPSQVRHHLDEIRDQLGALEASAVPDPDQVVALSSPSTHPTGGDDVPGDLLQSLDLGSSRTSAWARSGGKVSGSTSVAGSRSGSSAKSTTPTSVVDGDEDVDRAELLGQLFPDLHSTDITAALNSEDDLDSAIEYLLSKELICQVESQGYWPRQQEDQEAGHYEKPFISPKQVSKSANPSKGKKSRRKDQHAIVLVDTMQRRSNPSSNASSRAQSPERGSRPSPFAWDTIASLSAQLAYLIASRPPTYFSSYLHSPNHHSAYAAVRASLSNLPSSRVDNKEISQSVIEDLCGFSLTDGANESEREAIYEDIKVCVHAAGSDVATVLDLLDLLQELRGWPSENDDPYAHIPGFESSSEPLPPARIVPQASTRPNLQSSERLTTRPKKKQSSQPKPPRKVPGYAPAEQLSEVPTPEPTPHAPPVAKPTAGKVVKPLPTNWQTVSNVRVRRARPLHPLADFIPSYARNALPNDPRPGSLGFGRNNNALLTVEDCYTRAQAELDKRKAALLEAGRQFQSSGLSGDKSIRGAVAGHYAAQAREAADKARYWNLEAARMLVDNQMTRTGTIIDLHHFTVDEATVTAVEAAQKWWDARRPARVPDRDSGALPAPLRIIVGVGNHSTNGRTVIGPAVLRALQDAWRVDAQSGYLLVHAKR